MNGDTVMNNTEELPGSTKNETASKEFETICAPVEGRTE